VAFRASQCTREPGRTWPSVLSLHRLGGKQRAKSLGRGGESGLVLACVVPCGQSAGWGCRCVEMAWRVLIEWLDGGAGCEVACPLARGRSWEGWEAQQQGWAAVSGCCGLCRMVAGGGKDSRPRSFGMPPCQTWKMRMESIRGRLEGVRFPGLGRPEGS